jgi:hypothetical protein
VELTLLGLLVSIVIAVPLGILGCDSTELTSGSCWPAHLDGGVCCRCSLPVGF